MPYIQSEQKTNQGDALLYGGTVRSRWIVVPLAGDREAHTMISSTEEAICAELASANGDVERHSQIEVHGVRMVDGSTCDFIVVGRSGEKAILHAVVDPKRADIRFARLLSSSHTAIKHLYLVSERACYYIDLTTQSDTQKALNLEKVIENTTADYYGRVVDYLRKRWGEGIEVRKPLSIHRKD